MNSGESVAMQAPKERGGVQGRMGDRLFFYLTLSFALLVVALLVALLVVLDKDALPAIQQFGLSFLASTEWDPVKEMFGALPAIFGTLVTSIIALLIAVPVSFGSAVFLSELAPAWIREPASFLIEMLAAIPSVIIGLWGLYVMVPLICVPLEKWLGNYLGFVPLFQGPLLGGQGFLSAGIILAVMVVPIITAVSRDVMRAVPVTQREAMYALGATRWETISKTVLPYCRSGLLGAVILGLGRALGETMAVTMVIGNGYKLTASLFSPGATIASKIASEFSEASGDLYIGSLVELALVLFGITLIVNVIARLMVWRLTSPGATGE